MRVRTTRQRVGRGLLVVAGLINVLPVAGALSVSAAESAYGVHIAGSDLQTLMRHRAVMLALVGGSCIVAAFRPHLRSSAVIANVISFGSFLVIALANAPVNDKLTTVAWIDTAALLVLSTGAVLARPPQGEQRPDVSVRERA